MSGKVTMPFGMQNVMEEHLLPDLTTTFRLFGMHYRKVSKNWSIPTHSHPRLFEVNFLLVGSQTMIIDEKAYNQTEGDLLFIPLDTKHRCFVTSEPSMSFFCLHFHIDDELFRRSMLQLKHFLYPASSPIVKRIKPILLELSELTRSPIPLTLRDRLKIHEAAFQLLASLSEFIVTEKDKEISNQSENHQLTQEIAASIEQSVTWSILQNTASDFSRSAIKNTAHQYGVSESTLYRMFQNVYGMSPRQYLSNIILREAKQLLKNNDLTIQEISDLLGYRDNVCFSRQFKRWTGMAPKNFKKLFSEKKTDFRLETDL